MKIKVSTLILYSSIMVMLLRSSATIRLINSLNILLILAQMLIFIYFAVKVFSRKEKISGIIKIFIIFYIILLVSTILYSKDFNAYRSYMIQAIGSLLIIEYYIKKDYKILIKSIADCTSIILILNLITVILFRDGFSFGTEEGYYLLGIRIAFTPYVLLLLLTTLIYDKIQFNKKISSKSIMLIFIGLLNLIVKEVVTGIVTIGVVGLIILIFNKSKINNISFNKIMIMYSVLFIGIVVFSIQYRIPFFSYLLEDVMNKDLSFNNRDIIWASAIDDIKQRPVLGYGITAGGGVEVEFEYNTKILVAHNQILHVLHEGGFISLILFIIIFIKISNKMDNFKSDYSVIIIKSVLIGLLLMMITEVQSQKCIIFLILAIAYNLEYLINDKNEQENKKIQGDIIYERK